ncbi:hypothetical protein CPT32_15205 [Rhizobium sophoriradicis]|uniref:hypothetical protein n=1 Tax=Rhizobium sophoriradicis TaxID=1535245 RepID=UPI000BBDEB11|nr:hypothetical protein [Rhizobium sophoriradicis]PCK86154.1 hypothetical protein CPT32_15205 [Rhizobium sophoriradicis]
MPRRKSSETTNLETSGAKIGEAVPKAIIDVNTASVGIPRQPEEDLRAELSSLRKQIGMLQQQVLGAGRLAKDRAGKAIHQTEAVVKHHPLPTVLLVAAVAGVFAFASYHVSSQRRREPSALRDIRDFYDRMRERI